MPLIAELIDKQDGMYIVLDYVKAAERYGIFISPLITSIIWM